MSAMPMENDLHECANRKCKHHYKHSEAVMVRKKTRPGPKTLPSYTGTCPKCGHSSFYMLKDRKSPKPK